MSKSILWIVSYLAYTNKTEESTVYQGFKTKKDANIYIDWAKRIGVRGVSGPEKFCKS